MKIRAYIFSGIAFLLLLSFAYFIWPGRYDHFTLRRGSTEYPAYRDRFNNDVWICVPDQGWRKISEPSPPEQPATKPAIAVAPIHQPDAFDLLASGRYAKPKHEVDPRRPWMEKYQSDATIPPPPPGFTLDK